jgi:hypothetical protein
MMRVTLCACLLFGTISAYSQLSTQPTGSICGTALDESGLPARSIKVVAIYTGSHSGGMILGKTDESGHYCVEHLAFGDYVMSADDPENGYPMMGTSLFYSLSAPQQIVSITSENPTGHSDWKIPYKAGIVQVQLTDARTGKQIFPMFFNLAVRSKPEDRFLRGSGPSTVPLLVPPNEDIYFTVNAPGYQLWPYDGTKGRLLNLLPGTTQNIAIALQPIDP